METVDTETISVNQLFTDMFRQVQAPVLPAAVARLLAEINSHEPDIAKLEMIISAEPQISARVIRTINSSQFALRVQVKSVRHAIALLGFNRIRSIVLSYAMLDALPKPESSLFRHEMFWTDTLLRGLLARELCTRAGKHDPEEVFTAMILADVSVPVLLVCWEQHYGRIIARWQGNPKELSELEQSAFGWDHARASAWVLRHWQFPDDLVQLVADHNLDHDELKRRGLLATPTAVVATAALLPSSIKPLDERCHKLVRMARKTLGIQREAWQEIIDAIRGEFEAICEEFNLSGGYALDILHALRRTSGGDEEPET